MYREGIGRKFCTSGKERSPQGVVIGTCRYTADYSLGHVTDIRSRTTYRQAVSAYPDDWSHKHPCSPNNFLRHRSTSPQHNNAAHQPTCRFFTRLVTLATRSAMVIESYSRRFSSVCNVSLHNATNSENFSFASGLVGLRSGWSWDFLLRMALFPKINHQHGYLSR